MKKKRSVKHYFILPSYQLRLILFLGLAVIMGSIFHIAALNYFTAKNLNEHFNQEQIEQIWRTLQPSIILANSISCLLLIIFLVIMAVLISHKLAGPLLKITGHVKKIASGVIPDKALKLRDGDEGQLLCDAVNKLQTNLTEHKAKIDKIKTLVKDEEILKELQELSDEFQKEE